MSTRRKTNTAQKRVGKPLKLSLSTNEGREFVLEEVKHRDHPVARWWSTEHKNHRRVTIPVRVRCSAGRIDPAAVRRASELAIAEVSRQCRPATETTSPHVAEQQDRALSPGIDRPTATPMTPRPSSRETPPVGGADVGTLAEAVTHATSKTLNRRVSERWRADLVRYGNLAVTILGKDMPAVEVGPADFKRLYEAVAETTRGQLDALQQDQAAMDRFARSSPLASALAGIAADEFERGIDGDDDAEQPLRRAAAVSAAAELVVGRTARRELAVKLVNGVRTILRRAAACDGRRFKGCEAIGLPHGLKDDLYAHWRETFGDFELSDKPARERYSKRVAVQMLHALRDPRVQMQAILALAVGSTGTLRVRWGDIQLKGDVLGVHELTDKKRDNWTWRWVTLTAAVDLFRELLDGGYATALYGRAFKVDDLVIPSGRWTGLGDTPFIQDATPFELDPRMQLLYDLFAEKRLGSAVRLMRRQIHMVEEANGLMVATLPDVGKKRGFTQLFCPAQVESLVLAWTIGPLRELEAAYRAGRLRDYPIFPGGKLRDGYVPVGRAGTLKPLDRRTISKSCAKLERMVGFAPMLTEAEHAALLRAKSKRSESTRVPNGASHADEPTVDIWKGERPIVGNYGLRRALIDLAIEWDVPAYVADLLSCHAAPVNVDVGGRSPHGRGMRTGVYMKTDDLQLLLQAAKVMQRARTQRYEPMWLGFDDEDL